MPSPLLVRESTADQVRRLLRDADAYDALLLRRLKECDEPPGDLGIDGELPGEDELLIDTALYYAAAERTARARTLVRRDRLLLDGVAVVAVCAALANRR